MTARKLDPCERSFLKNVAKYTQTPQPVTVLKDSEYHKMAERLASEGRVQLAPSNWYPGGYSVRKA